MAFDSEEIRKRQQRRRQEQERRRERQQQQKRRLTLGLIIAAVALALCGMLILLLQHGGSSDNDPSDTASQPVQTQPTQAQTVITIAFGGDLNVTDRVVASGASEDGYDYTDVFMDVTPILAGADAAVVNLEGNLCGAPYGSESSSAPQELMEALSAAGVDMIQMANSCAINNGLIGLQKTLEGIRAAGMEPVGAYATTEEAEQARGFTLRSINGVKVAFVAFTKGMDGLGLPEGSENCVNLLYEDYTSAYSDIDSDRIREILRAVALEEPDVTVALLHWGSEYNSIVSESQTAIVELMQEEGVDAIIGTHSHYVQAVEYDSEAGTLVAYSLGDLLGDAEKSYTNASMILRLEITKDNTSGTASITGYDYTPIYIEKEGVEGVKLLRITEAMAAYEANSIHKVSAETYSAMKSALSRIKSRVTPES